MLLPGNKVMAIWVLVVAASVQYILGQSKPQNGGCGSRTLTNTAACPITLLLLTIAAVMAAAADIKLLFVALKSQVSSADISFTAAVALAAAAADASDPVDVLVSSAAARCALCKACSNICRRNWSCDCKYRLTPV